MEYKVGDKVYITHAEPYWNHKMDEFLGQVMTIRKIEETSCGFCYKMEEDMHIETQNEDPSGWDWFDNMISGLAVETEDADEEMEDPGDNECLNTFLDNFKI